MTGTYDEATMDKAKAFFQRGEEVASTKNYDYAIDLYLEGLRLVPDALELGHIPLRKMAIDRHAMGGKKASIVDKMKHHGGKTPLEEMLNASYLIARDPDNMSYAEALLKACAEGGYKRTGGWIADMVFEANMAKAKPSAATFLLLKDCFGKLELFEKAIEACSKALKLKPEDSALHDELRNLSANLAVQKGKYDRQGDFTQSIKDSGAQEMIRAQESMVKSGDYLAGAVESARESLAKNPGSPTSIIRLADALYELGPDEAYDEAVRLLESAWNESKDFTFKKHLGQIRIAKIKARIRRLKDKLDAEPGDGKAKAQLDAAVTEFGDIEIEHYKLCVDNYPTDLKMKYEYALRLLVCKKFDEAIPLFQQAQKDPRYKIVAMSKTGLCFFFKSWYSDAVDIFVQALESCQSLDGSHGKDIRYNLARSYEEMGKNDEALELYRKLAQLDFNYKDVRVRVDKLRNNDVK